MRKFVIEDRGKGVIVAEGAISEEGAISWLSTKPTVEKELEELKSQIQRDVSSGFSGGRLRAPFEWMELMSGS